MNGTACPEPAPEKVTDFSAKNMLQLFDSEPLLLARVTQPERKMLQGALKFSLEIAA
jgi:hypothetical protein